MVACATVFVSNSIHRIPCTNLSNLWKLVFLAGSRSFLINLSGQTSTLLLSSRLQSTASSSNNFSAKGFCCEKKAQLKMASESERRSDLFDLNKNMFSCIVLDMRDEKHACDDDVFIQRIDNSLTYWKETGVRAVTIYIPNHLTHRVPHLISLGFDFHHAQPGYALLLKWLSETEFNNFPAYANHYLGVAGFVVNDKEQVLAIKESFLGGAAKWKLPGGGADAGEDLSVTACREVYEETGIKTEFIGVICFRQQHNFRYNCSDFYFVCLLKALNTDIKKCDQEIQAAQWMDINEYGKADLYPSNRFIYESYMRTKQTGIYIKPYEVMSWTGKYTHLMYRPDNNQQTEPTNNYNSKI